MPDDQLSSLAREAVERLGRDLVLRAPTTAPVVREWMCRLAGSERPEDYFLRSHAYPLLALPDWFARSLGQSLDEGFLRALVDSSVNGYYFIRLIDNVMDGDATVEGRLLPLTQCLQLRLQGGYRRHFAAEHPFWELYERVSGEYVEVTVRDAGLGEIDRDAFLAVSGRKFCGAKIPLGAAGHHLGRTDLLEPWFRWLDVLGCWYQMRNDLFSWSRDLSAGRSSYLLTEGARQAEPGEGVAAWMVRRGCDWALTAMGEFMVELEALGEELASPHLQGFVETQKEILRDKSKEVRRGFQGLSALLSTFDS